MIKFKLRATRKALLFLYKLNKITNIKNVLILIIIVSIIIFPIFIDANFVFLSENKKAYYTINLFKKVKLLSGYIELNALQIIIHLTENKAIIVPLSLFLDMGKKFKPLKDYHILNWKLKLEIGLKDNIFSVIVSTFILSYIENHLRWFLNNKKPYLKIDNNICVYEDENVFNVYLNACIVLNLLMIILSFIKIFLEKIIYAISSRKQQNYKSN